MALYPQTEYEDRCKGKDPACTLKWQADAMLRDYFFACPARRVAKALAGQGSPAWTYEFDYDFNGGLYNNAVIGCKLGLGCVPGPGGLGAFHMSELPFVFGTSSA